MARKKKHQKPPLDLGPLLTIEDSLEALRRLVGAIAATASRSTLGPRWSFGIW
jgi:hypothetical protein